MTLTIDGGLVDLVQEWGVTIPASALFHTCTDEVWDSVVDRLDPRTIDAESRSLRISFHSYVIRRGGKTILVDTCNGNHKSRQGFAAIAANLDTDYIANLARVGLTPEDIDYVFCTHLHFDHVGWNTRLEDGRWVPTFPRAKYLFSRADKEHFERLWQAGTGFPGIECYEDSIVPVLASGQVELIDAKRGFGLVEGVHAEPAAGHTPGCLTLRLHGERESAVFIGDVAHHPIQVCAPTLGVSDEWDTAAANAVRARLLAECADRPVWFLGAHFPAPTFGRIVSDHAGLTFRYRDSD
jgi:glyoxylase-like metal-dependent hydrolase (beta-lactamase superfamily II)